MPPPLATGFPSWCAAALLAAALAGSGARADAVTQYAFDIPDGPDAAFEIEFVVDHPGRVAARAEWPGGRILSFRLEGPGSPLPVRVLRSGPSPQKIEVSVPAESTGPGREWRLVIRALPGRGASKATLRIDRPGPEPAAPAASPAAAEPPLGTSDALPAWARPRPDLAASGDPLVAPVERFRAAIITDAGDFTSDPCSWHADFLRHMAEIRDGTPVDADEHACLARLAAAVRAVDELRTSGDPLLAGPVPADPGARVVWRARRGDRIRPLETELDDLLRATRNGACSGSVERVWPARFSACLAACERHFEERVRIADEAANAELARTEWDRFLDAASALEALARRLP